ncbi:MAG: hypothetical protein K6U74_00405 [Firmicutes bacterium]|nr:hypothetical protein [Bacillota bacterium]
MSKLFKASAADLAALLESALNKLGYVPQSVAGHFIYAPGSLPVLLVAHLDTAHPSLPVEIFHDREKGVLWSPQGLGADDRAGVWAIHSVLSRGYRPHVLFCDLEESGGLGAREAVTQISRPAVDFILELDRRGADDYVMYGWRSPELEAFLEVHGFRQAAGSFSDISVLCPAWELPGANLSVGFYKEHTQAEYLRLPELFRTVDRVCRMLRELPGHVSYVEERFPADCWDDLYDDRCYDDMPPPVRLSRGAKGKKYKILKGEY